MSTRAGRRATKHLVDFRGQGVSTIATSSLCMVALIWVTACSGSSFWQREPEPTPEAEAPTYLDLQSTAHRFGAITIRPGFYPDPYSLTGTSGGVVDTAYAGTSPTGLCSGFADARPNHLLTIGAEFEHLRLSIEAQGDTTLLVHGPGGWRCADDTDGQNPSIGGPALAGTYRVWVGSDSAQAQYQYTLSLTQTAPPEPEPEPEPEPPPPVAVPSGLDVAATASRQAPVALSAGFRPDPVVVQGRTSGRVDAAYIGYTASGSCSGATHSQPDHLMTLHSPIAYLRIEAQSTDDVSLIINTPGGWLCNNSADGPNPRVEGQFEAGTYQIWVGNESAARSATYELSFSQTPTMGAGPAALNTESLSPRFEAVTLSSPFSPDPRTVAGRSGGSVDAAYLGQTAFGSCRGFADELANHTLTVQAPIESLRVAAVADGDTTLLIHGPDGWRCNDDETGLNPAIRGYFTPGTYRIWVGSYEYASGFDYTLSFSSQGSAGAVRGLDTTAVIGRFGEARLRPHFRPDPTTLSGIAGGTEDVTSLGYTATGPCQGVADSQPNHVLTVDGELPYLRLDAQGGDNLTLLTHGPRGWRCVAAEPGQPARLEGAFAPGAHRVWVGTTAPQVSPNYTLSVSAAEPAPTALGLDDQATTSRYPGLRLRPSMGGRSQSLQGMSGGSIDTAYLGSTAAGQCRGFADTTPSHVLELDNDSEYLRFDVQGGGDPSLIVQGPEGWLCSDDATGLLPSLEGSFPAGTYRIWVGSIRPDEEQGYVLLIDQTPAEQPSAGGELDTSGFQSRYPSLSFSPGFWPDPQTLEGVAEGSIDARSLGTTAQGPCVGYTSDTPAHFLTLNQPFSFLRLHVESTGDTTLVVHGPDGWMCNDDTIGLQPVVEGRFQQGTYRVWIGTYAPGLREDYRLQVSEMR